MTNDTYQLILLDRSRDVNEKDVSNCYTVKDLLFEVIENGFKTDLCLSRYDAFREIFSLLGVVNAKIDSAIHKQRYQSALSRPEMLALVLYTGCDCNYDLCQSQRNGNHSKWKIFDSLLYDAIFKLSLKEKLLNCKLFSGLRNVQTDTKKMLSCYFPTYVSTTFNKDVAMAFIQSNGMLIEIDADVCQELVCCSVDWISKFHDECEILIARSNVTNHYTFDLNVQDTLYSDAQKKIKDLQIVSLSLNKDINDSRKHSNIKDFLALVKYTIDCQFIDDIGDCKTCENYKFIQTVEKFNNHPAVRKLQRKVKNKEKLSKSDLSAILNDCHLTGFVNALFAIVYARPRYKRDDESIISLIKKNPSIYIKEIEAVSI